MEEGLFPLNIEDDDENEEVEANNIQERVSGITEEIQEQYKVTQQTALNRFNEFLQHQHVSDPEHYTFTEYSKDELSTCEIVSKFLDEFANWLLKVRKVPAFSTVSQYLSKVKMKITRDHKHSQTLIFGNGQWYKDIRTKVASAYMKKCAEEGTPLVQHAKQLTEDDLLIMSSLCFKKNSVQADQDRGILIMQRQTIGRVSETSKIKCASVKLYTRTRPKKRRNHTLVINRQKTSTQQELNIIMHANSWLLCPIHALGSLLVTSENGSPYIFPNIPVGSEATYVNRLLKSLYAAWSSDENRDPLQVLSAHLSSHSGRSGGAQDAQDCVGIQIQWVILRGIITV